MDGEAPLARLRNGATLPVDVKSSSASNNQKQSEERNHIRMHSNFPRADTLRYNTWGVVTESYKCSATCGRARLGGGVEWGLVGLNGVGICGVGIWGGRFGLGCASVGLG